MTLDRLKRSRPYEAEIARLWRLYEVARCADEHA